MKENLHPNYKQTTITCACGNVIETGSTKEFVLKYAPNATRSLLANRNLLIQADVLTCLRNVMACRKNNSARYKVLRLFWFGAAL